MLAAMLLAFREGLEAALILGIALGVLRRTGQTHQARFVWLGAGLAAVAAIAAGVGLQALGLAFEGAAEQIFEGVAMLLAAGVLTWMIFWMARRGRTMRADLERDVRRATGDEGRRWALFSLAFLAVLREGVELALFLTAAAMAASAGATVGGALAGLAAAAVAGWLIFATTKRLNVGAFLRVTGVALVFFAAGLFAHGVHEFNEVGWVPAVIEHVWDLNPILHENSIAGELLKALFGYNGNPSLTEVAAYLGYWVVVSLTLWRRSVAQRAPLPVVAGD